METDKLQRLERIDTILSSTISDKELSIFDEHGRRNQKKYEILQKDVIEKIQEYGNFSAKDITTVLITMILKERQRVMKTIN